MPNVDVARKILKKVLADIEEGVIVTDLERKIKEISKGAVKLTGISETEALEQPLDTVCKLYKEDTLVSTEEYCPIDHLEIEGIVFKDEDLKLIDKAGETRIVDVTVTKVREGEEADIGCIIILHDKSKETELEHMKLDFISMSAHVLRTPITILRGYSQTLLKENTISKLNDIEIDAVNQISTASNDLRDRVENMLALANIKDGDIKVNPIPMSLEGTIKAVIESFKPHARDKNLELMYIPSQENLPRVYAEVGKVKEVLEKLLDNAIKFTEHGKVEIGIVRTGEHLKTYIKDSGPGVPDEGKTQLFTKFYRVKRNALNMESGNGLSLYTCKKLINTMGGEIGVESVYGNGATFYFTLPIYSEDLGKVQSLI